MVTSYGKWANPDALTLLEGKWDWVIITYDQLLAKYKSFKAAYKADNGKRVKAGLFSKLLKETGSTIRFLVLDEVQNALRVEGRRHAAIKALSYSRGLFLSSTFIPDNWYEIHEILAFMPRPHPFMAPRLFDAAFRPWESDREFDRLESQTRIAYANRLIVFILPNLVARPAAVLSHVDGCVRESLQFDVDPADEAAIIHYTRGFYTLLRKRMQENGGRPISNDFLHGFDQDKKKGGAMALAMFTQQASASRLLLTRRPTNPVPHGSLPLGDTLRDELTSAGALQPGQETPAEDRHRYIKDLAEVYMNWDFQEAVDVEQLEQAARYSGDDWGDEANDADSDEVESGSDDANLATEGVGGEERRSPGKEQCRTQWLAWIRGFGKAKKSMRSTLGKCALFWGTLSTCSRSTKPRGRKSRSSSYSPSSYASLTSSTKPSAATLSSRLAESRRRSCFTDN